MTARIVIPVADVTDLLDADSTLLRVERNTVEFLTVALAANVLSYEVSDPDGTAGDSYRWRFSEGDGANPTAYRGPVEAIAAYATLTELLQTWGTEQPTDATELARLSALLVTASGELDREIGHDFWPHAETRHFTAESLWVPIPAGIQSITTLTVNEAETTDYTLEPDTPPAGDPYTAIRLVTRPWWAWRNVEVEGVFGWASVPADITESVIARARQLHGLDPSLGGLPSVGNDYGSLPRLPDVMWRTIRRYAAKGAAAV